MPHHAHKLERLYGPLLAVLSSTTAVFSLFARSVVGVQYPEGMPELMRRVAEDDTLRESYVEWMETSILPAHQRVATIIEQEVSGGVERLNLAAALTVPRCACAN